MSQAGVNIYRKLTIRFSLLLFEGGSWSSSSFCLACFEGQTQTPMSSYFSSKPEFISLVKSSSLKCIEHEDEVFPGARPHLPPLQHKIDPFLSPPQSLRACGAKGRNPVHAYSIRFVFDVSTSRCNTSFWHFRETCRNTATCFLLFSVRFRERLKSRVPESTSQLLLNREETNANGGPKWRAI